MAKKKSKKKVAAKKASAAKSSTIDPKLKEGLDFLQSHGLDGHYLKKVQSIIEEEGFKVDYIEEFDGRRFGAVHLGTVRLIDNVKR